MSCMLTVLHIESSIALDTLTSDNLVAVNGHVAEMEDLTEL